jgi:hypothetical protein
MLPTRTPRRQMVSRLLQQASKKAKRRPSPSCSLGPLYVVCACFCATLNKAALQASGPSCTRSRELSEMTH